MISLEHIFQILTLLFGVPAVWMVGHSGFCRRWGFVVGLISQPFWAGTLILAHQYPLLIGTAFYTYMWYVGLRKNWR